MEYLFDRGTPIDKPIGNCHKEFFEKNQIPHEEAKEYEYSLMQKSARSTCIYKNTLILDRLMRARQIMAQNLFNGKLT